VVASFDGAAITQSDVEQEYKLEDFLEAGRLPDRPPDPAIFGRILGRLIDQRVLAGEVETEGLSALDVRRAVAERLSEIRKKFPSDQAFHSALRSLGMDENQLRAKLEEQQRVVQMIDRRMRPDATPNESEVEAYYHTTFVPELARRGGSPPTLTEVEDQIVEILVQKKIGQLLEAWLKELRSTHRIRILASSAG
jgi:hypothetical protein